MRTLTELKKILTTGTRLKVLYHGARPEQVGNIKTITKAQTNCIYTTCKDDRNGREIRTDIPQASLIEFDNNTFTIYDMGSRELNEQEKNFIKTKKQEFERYPYNNPYFTALSLAKKMNVEYMVTTQANGKYFNHNTNRVIDPTIKGEKFLTFEIL